jgi:hypothetical protein
MPPSLLCPALCQSSREIAPSRDGWGYDLLQLKIAEDGRLRIHTGPLQWIPQSNAAHPLLPSGAFADRSQDILLRMGEVATSPELAHLMIQPESFSACLSGQNSMGDLTLITDRAKILSLMPTTPPTDAILNAIQLLVSHLPSVTPQTFPTPLSILAWRVECPQPTILYVGHSEHIDLSSQHAHTGQVHRTPQYTAAHVYAGYTVSSWPVYLLMHILSRTVHVHGTPLYINAGARTSIS